MARRGTSDWGSETTTMDWSVRRGVAKMGGGAKAARGRRGWEGTAAEGTRRREAAGRGAEATG